MIHPNVSDLPGHLLRIVFAVHDVVNVNTHVLNVVRLVESINNFHVNHNYHTLVFCGLGWVEKSQICKIRHWLPSAMSELAGRLLLRGP